MANKKYFDKLSFLDYGDIYVKDTESREKNTQLENELNVLTETVNNNKNETDNKFNDVNSKIRDTNGRIDNVNSRVDTANNNVSNLSSRVANLESTKSILANRFFIFVGDSYMYGYTPDGKIEGFADKVKRVTGLSGNIFARGGEGFAKSGPYGNFLDRLKDYTGNTDKVTDVIVIGGYNDQGYSYSEIGSGISEFYNYMHSHFPNATLSIGMDAWSTSPTKYNGIRKVLEAYTKASESVPFRMIKNIEYALHFSDFFSSDGFHPNTDGQNAIANYLVSWILGGDINVVRGYDRPRITSYSSFNLGDTSQFYTQLNNNVAEFLCSSQTRVVCNIAQDSFNGYHGNRHQILTLAGNTCIEGANFGEVLTTPSSCVVTVPTLAKFGGEWFNVSLTIELISSGLFINIMALAKGGSGYASGTCTEFILPSFQIIAQSMCA